jgi:surface antigen
MIRYGILGANVAVLGGIIFFVTNNPDSGSAVRQSSLATTSKASAAAALDQLSSADIAVHASRLTGLTESVAITNQADSEATQLAITATENRVIAKPQIVATSLKSAKDIRAYVAVDGDTLSGLAAKFGVTSDSIRWSNGLSSERIAAGKQLVIPPVSGVVYTVKSGDTVESLAQHYSSTKEQILADNDAEVSGIKAGQRLLIRGGIQPVVRAAAVSYSSSFFGGSAQYGYNGYDYGYCTWYVANKRLAAGRVMPTNLGNAATWATRAAAYGLSTGRTPQVGAAVVTATRGAGHVALVERINDDGSVWISEMNSSGQASIDNPAPAGGWGRVDYKLVSAGQASNYSYVY